MTWVRDALLHQCFGQKNASISQRLWKEITYPLNATGNKSLTCSMHWEETPTFIHTLSPSMPYRQNALLTQYFWVPNILLFAPLTRKHISSARQRRLSGTSSDYHIRCSARPISEAMKKRVNDWVQWGVLPLGWRGRGSHTSSTEKNGHCLYRNNDRQDAVSLSRLSLTYFFPQFISTRTDT